MNTKSIISQLLLCFKANKVLEIYLGLLLFIIHNYNVKIYKTTLCRKSLPSINNSVFKNHEDCQTKTMECVTILKSRMTNMFKADFAAWISS